MTAPQSAREVFRAAYENRYTWDQDFPGFRADVALVQGGTSYQGQVQINPDLTILLRRRCANAVNGITDASVRSALDARLRDLVTHRQRSPFEQTHGKNTFSFGNTDPDGTVEILVQGEAMGSYYKVRDRQIVLVHRVMGRMAFTITHRQSLNTPQGYAATHYDAVFSNPETQAVLRTATFEDTYEPVGGYDLMTRQVVHSQEPGQDPATTIFTFSNIQRLSPIAA
ncbi:DUF3386 domain-containing protein [Trichothermofontia sp.]